MEKQLKRINAAELKIGDTIALLTDQLFDAVEEDTLAGKKVRVVTNKLIVTEIKQLEKIKDRIVVVYLEDRPVPEGEDPKTDIAIFDNSQNVFVYGEPKKNKKVLKG